MYSSQGGEMKLDLGSERVDGTVELILFFFFFFFNFIFLCFKIRFMLKVHAFVRENAHKVLSYKKSKGK